MKRIGFYFILLLCASFADLFSMTYEQLQKLKAQAPQQQQLNIEAETNFQFVINAFNFIEEEYKKDKNAGESAKDKLSPDISLKIFPLRLDLVYTNNQDNSEWRVVAKEYKQIKDESDPLNRITTVIVKLTLQRDDTPLLSFYTKQYEFNGISTQLNQNKPEISYDFKVSTPLILRKSLYSVGAAGLGLGALYYGWYPSGLKISPKIQEAVAETARESMRRIPRGLSEQ